MASLHASVRSHSVHSSGGPLFNPTTHNPFLKSEPEAPALRPINQNGPVAESLEVTVLWGTNVLAVEQLCPPRPYAVGEVGGAGGAGTSIAGNVDFALSSERLGTDRRELVAMR